MIITIGEKTFNLPQQDNAFFAIPERQEAQRVALSGRVLRQVSPPSYTAANLNEYRGLVKKELAYEIAELANTEAFCTFSDGKKVFEAVWKPRLDAGNGGSKIFLIIELKIVKELL